MNRLECIEVLKETSKEIRKTIDQRIAYLSTLNDEVFETYSDEYITDLLVAPKPVINKLAKLEKIVRNQAVTISEQERAVKSLTSRLYLTRKFFAEAKDRIEQKDTIIAALEKEFDTAIEERDALHSALKNVVHHNEYLSGKLNDIKEIANG